MLYPFSFVFVYFVQNGNFGIYFITFPSSSRCFSHTFHLCCCYSFCVSCLMVQFSLQYNTTGRTSIRVLCGFILVLFKVFCAMNILLITLLFYIYINFIYIYIKKYIFNIFIQFAINVHFYS